MSCLRVDVVSGHYRVPGQGGQGVTAASFELAPPTTVMGFLESLCGEESGSFGPENQVAIGLVNPNQGHGFLARKDHNWNSGGIKPKSGGAGEDIRMVLRETHFFLSYRISVRGPYAEKIRKALNGEVDRYGVLSLGESGDVVDWLCEETGDANWLVPGTQVVLPVKTGRGYGTMDTVYRSFDFTDAGEPPEAAWLNLAAA